MPQSKHRAFLKWAGGKYSLIEKINKELPKAKVLVEPFVGAGSVFLNSEFEAYHLNDINEDLINLYKILQTDSTHFITEAEPYFTPQFNQEAVFYQQRERFNDSTDPFERSVLFLYLNRHGYNGLCRYNLSGKFNVPFGRYKAPYFPKKELQHFAQKAARATFTCLPFQQVMLQSPEDSVIYCDPPYAPVSETAYFTSYAKQGFSLDLQEELAELALHVSEKLGRFVLVSNHDTPFTRRIYKPAKLRKLSVARFISQNGDNRKKVAELLAVYNSVK